MEGKSNHRRRHRIRGDLRPYSIPAFVALRKQILTGPLNIDDVIRYREIFKQLLADRVRVSLRALYEPLPKAGVAALLEALDVRPQYADLRSFLSCTLDYYNQQALCEYHTAAPAMAAKPSSGRLQKKMVKDALKSMCRVAYVEVRPVLRELKRQEKSLMPSQHQIVEKYRTMTRAVSLLYLFFRALYLQPLPARIPAPVYDRVRVLDRRLEAYYGPENGGYRLSVKKEKKPAAVCLGAGTAVTLFIQLLP